LRLQQDAYYPDSFGDLYGRVTELLGFRAGADEHKVQWLSTLASAHRFEPLFKAIIGGTWPSFDRGYIDTGRTGSGGFSAKFYTEAGLEDGAPVPEDIKPSIAAGLQAAIEKSVTAMAGDAENVCLAGGLAFNALLVSALERSHNVFA